MPAPHSDQNWRPLDDELEWRLSRRTVLKTGGLASGTLGLGSKIEPAAARREDEGRFSEGVPVIDREDPDPDTAIVINVLDVPISEWIVFGSETVADHNPTYDSDDQVVIVTFDHRLDSGWSDWRRARPATLFDGVVSRGIKFHAFPRARLDRRRSNDSKVNRD